MKTLLLLATFLMDESGIWSEQKEPPVLYYGGPVLFESVNDDYIREVLSLMRQMKSELIRLNIQLEEPEYSMKIRVEQAKRLDDLINKAGIMIDNLDYKLNKPCLREKN